MPIILSVVISLVYVVFILHDKNRMESTANGCVIRSQLRLRHDLLLESGKIDYEKINAGDIYASILGVNKEKENICKEDLKEKLNKGLLISKLNNIDLNLDREKIKYQLEIQWKIGVPLVKNFLKEKNAILVRETKYQDAPDFVRKTAALLGGNFSDKN